MRLKPIFPRLLVLVLTCCLGACGQSEDIYSPTFSNQGQAVHEYTFAVHPLHNPSRLHQVYAPLIAYLNANVRGARFKLVASRDYATFDQRLAAGEFDFALPNPYQAMRAVQSGYRIFGKVAGDEGFRGIILTRRNSPIRTITDLRGRTISYPSPTAVAATMLPQYYLQAHGVPLSSTTAIYVGSMESALRSLDTGASDAAAIWPEPWNQYSRSNPEAAGRLQVRWTTPSLVNNALVVRESVPPAIADHMLAALQHLSQEERGRALLNQLAIAGFERADYRTYEPVRRFLREFSRTVRPLPPFEGPAR